MKKINFKEHILPHIIAVLVFLIVVILYFSPVIFENKVLNQPDIIQWQGGAQELIDHRESTGEEGLWTNSMFGGMPGYLVNVKWDNYPIEILQQIMALGLPHPIWYVFLAFVSYYILLLTFGVRPYLAIGGAIAFGFSSFNIIGLSAGHSARIGAIAFMPLVLAGIHLTYSRWKLMGFALTATALALHLRINHLQITYYLLLIVIIYSIYRLIIAVKQKELFSLVKTNLLLFGAAIIALGTFMGQFWSVYQYSKYSTRGASELTSSDASSNDGLAKDYAFSYSNGILEPMTLFIPYFYGGSSAEELGSNSNLAEALRNNGLPPVQVAQQLKQVPTYWGNQPLSAPYYTGAIIVFLFILGILKIDIRHSWWLLLATALAIMLSWGDNFETFNYLMFDYFPGYNKFRSVTFALVMAIFSMPLLGFMALEVLIKEGLTPQNKKHLLLATAIAGGIALIAIIFAFGSSFRGAIDERLGNLPPWFLDALRDDRRSLLQKDAFRSLFLVLACASIVYFYLHKKLSEALAFGLLIVLNIGDHYLVNKRYVNEKNFERNPSRDFFAENEADRFIKEDKDLHYRVYNLQNPFNEARTSYHHSSIGGYHGAKLRRYQELIEHCISPETNTMIAGLQSGNPDFNDYDVLNMLNAKYLTYGEAKNTVLKNEAALGNAWLVQEVNSVNSPDEELQQVCNIDSEQTAVVDASKFKVSNKKYGASGSIILEEYKPNYLKYNYESTDESFVVFSEIYYPEGWKVTVDGKESSHIRANYILRAMEVPAGKHVIEFRFEPQVYTLGNSISFISSVLLILILIFSLGWTIKKTRGPEVPELGNSL